jgi:hypothetical protein
MIKTSLAMATRAGSPSAGETNITSDRIARALGCILGCAVALLIIGGTATAQQPTAASTPAPRPDPDCVYGNRTPVIVTDSSAPVRGTYGPWDFTSFSQAPNGAPTPTPPPDGPGGAWTVLLPGQQ